MVNTLNNHVVQEGQQQDAKCGVIMCRCVTVWYVVTNGILIKVNEENLYITNLKCMTRMLNIWYLNLGYLFITLMLQCFCGHMC